MLKVYVDLINKNNINKVILHNSLDYKSYKEIQ